MNKMRAVVKTEKGVGLIELREVPIPEPREGEVLIKVKAGGICGTDIYIRHDAFPYYPPVILGHEFSGEIVEIGKNVEEWKVGDRVVAEPHSKACGVCDLCRAGYSQICPNKRSPGWGIDGAFAEYIKMPTHLLHRIPDSISFESAAVIEPLTIILHEVVERGNIEAGDKVVIFGAGPIGLLAAKISYLSGASYVILVGTDQDKEYRFELAKKIPMDIIVNVSHENLIEKVEELTNGKLADVAIEASGSPKAISQLPDVVRKRGRIIAVGLPGKEPVSFPWEKAMFKVLDLYFNLSSSHSAWVKAIALLENKKIDPDFVVTHKFPLEEWEKAFDLVELGKCGKVLLIPQEQKYFRRNWELDNA